MTEFDAQQELLYAIETSTITMTSAINLLEKTMPKRPEQKVSGYIDLLSRLNESVGRNNMLAQLVKSYERKKMEEKLEAERKKKKKLEEAAIINNFKEGTK